MGPPRTKPRPLHADPPRVPKTPIDPGSGLAPAASPVETLFYWPDLLPQTSPVNWRRWSGIVVMRSNGRDILCNLVQSLLYTVHVLAKPLIEIDGVFFAFGLFSNAVRDNDKCHEQCDSDDKVWKPSIDGDEDLVQVAP